MGVNSGVEQTSFDTQYYQIIGMSRERIIKTPASQSGRQCPKDNIQWKPCPPVPCYQWIAGSWSHCQLHVSNFSAFFAN